MKATISFRNTTIKTKRASVYKLGLAQKYYLLKLQVLQKCLPS